MIRRAMICSLALWSTASLAQNGTGVYLGGGLGQYDYSYDEVYGPLDDATLSYKLYGGYRFNETWALEGSYVKTDDLSGIIPLTNLTLTSQRDFEILEVRGLAHFKPFFAGIGYWDADLKGSFSGTLTGPVPGRVFSSFSESDSGLSIILGGEWDLDRFGIRVELDAYEMDDLADDPNVYSLGLGFHYRF